MTPHRRAPRWGFGQGLITRPQLPADQPVTTRCCGQASGTPTESARGLLLGQLQCREGTFLSLPPARAPGGEAALEHEANHSCRAGVNLDVCARCETSQSERRVLLLCRIAQHKRDSYNMQAGAAASTSCVHDAAGRQPMCSMYSRALPTRSPQKTPSHAHTEAPELLYCV